MTEINRYYLISSIFDNSFKKSSEDNQTTQIRKKKLDIVSQVINIFMIINDIIFKLYR